MHTKTTLVLLAAALTLAPIAARAQLPVGGLQATASKPTWMSNRVSLTMSNASMPQVLRALLDKAGVKTYTMVLTDGGLNDRILSIVDGKVAGANDDALARHFGRTTSVDLKNVTAELALQNFAEAAGVKFTFGTENEHLTILVEKTAAGYGTVYNISPKSSIDPAIASALTQAQKTARDVQMFYTAPNVLRLNSGARLPDTRVKLDVRGGDMRDILQTVLKQANLDYALEDDVPATPKRSFTFENVPIATALDVICKSADVGWRAETHGGKTLVRVGKKYAAKSAFAPAFPYNNLFVAPPAIAAPPKVAR